MFNSIYDFKDFYNTNSGLLVEDVVRKHIRNWWPNLKNQSLLGIGYAQPYLVPFLDEADRCIAVNPARTGAYSWPADQRNLTILAEETELPFETNSVDRVLLVHTLEYAELSKSNLQEVWRVLKSNGRILIITPNRRGLWSRAEWSPYGQGTPYTIDQLKWTLRDTQFTCERSKSILYMPPLRLRVIEKFCHGFEKIGPFLMPGLGGLHMIEASKQLYAGISVPASTRVIVRDRTKALTSPIPSGRHIHQ